MKNSSHSFTPAEQTTESLLQAVGDLLSIDTQNLTTQKVQAALGEVKLGKNGEEFLAQFQGSWDELRAHLVGLSRALKGDHTPAQWAIPIDSPNEDESYSNLFPEGTEIASLPKHVQDSFSNVQQLFPKKQSKISYYEKGGEWYINIDGTKISLQNESAPSNPDAGINVAKGNTYFNQPAALAHAEKKGKSLPTNVLWSQMAQFLGWYSQLRDILQIKLTGWFHPNDGLEWLGYYADVWSAGGRGYLSIDAGGGDVKLAYDPHYGLNVRLLDA